MAKCEKCGGTVFLVDETCTYLEIDGEIFKQQGPGELHNRNCVRCTYPTLYPSVKHYDEE